MSKHYFFPQLSPMWWAAHRGLPTAGNFDRIITPKKRELAAAHVEFIHELIGQCYDPNYATAERYQNENMRNGTEGESEAREWYAYEHAGDLEVTQIGMVLTDCGRFGCSPDGLVGNNGLVQIKRSTPKIHASYLLDGALPVKFAPQCYGELYVTGREWLDFISYCPGMPRQLVVRVHPEGFFWDALEPILEQFHENYAVAFEKIAGATVPPLMPPRTLAGIFMPEPGDPAELTY